MSRFVKCNICGSDGYDIVHRPDTPYDDNRICGYKITEHKNKLIVGIVRCKECGLIYVNPQPELSDILGSYKHMKDNLYIEQEKGRRLSAERILKKIERFKRAGRLLDVGCSAGFLLDEARKRGWEVYGIEPSLWAREYAMNSLGLGNIFDMDSFNNCLNASYFDVVVINDTIEHVIDPAGLLSCARRLLKPDGLLYISTPDISSIAAGMLKKKWWGIKNHHLHYFTPETVKKLLKICGFDAFKISRQVRFFQINYILHLLGISKKGIYNRYLQKLPVIKAMLYIDLHDQLEVFAKKQRKLCYIDELEYSNNNENHIKPKVIVVLPAYNASGTLKRTFDDIPKNAVDDIILVDDKSKDNTIEVAKRLGIKTFEHQINKGYGANQKRCYQEALALEADIIVMVHPDYQYDPKIIPELTEPIRNNRADAVFGSRMMKGGALQGGMPRWKHNANILLTAFENVCFGTYLTEYHSGFRAYSSKLLHSIDFMRNSDSFIFDTEIIVQALIKGFKLEEIPIRTRYFDEASKINLKSSIFYGFGIVKTVIKYAIHKKTPFKFKQFL